MSVYWDTGRQRWRYQFKATVGGRVHRRSKLLPPGCSEAQAKRFDREETARTFALIVADRGQRAPPIIQALTVYLQDAVPDQRDRRNAIYALELLAEFAGGRRLDELGEVSREYQRAHANLAPATVAQRLRYLRAAARYAHRHYGIGRLDWISAISIPPVDNERSVFLTRRQILVLARACTHRPTRALILMAFGTGSRPGELHRSEPQDGRLAVPQGKNGETIVKPVPVRLQRYLRHWPMPLDYTRYSAHFRKARDKAGMPHVHLHDLRHSTASALLAGGATLAQVGEVLDHKSLQSTKRYVHLADTSKQKLLETLWQKSPHTRKTE